MLRGTRLALGLTILLTATAQGADETYTIRLKRAARGETVATETESSQQMRVRLKDTDGNTVKDQENKSSEQFNYREAVLEKKADDKRPTRLERTYEKAELTAEGKKQSFPYEGKTVVIEKKGDRYQFRIKDGDELTGAAAAYLDREFNSPDQSKLDDEMFLPKKPVALAEAWPIDVGPLAKSFEKMMPVQIDVERARASGKLVKVYQKDGRQYGILQLKVELPLKQAQFGNNKVPFKNLAKAVVETTLDGCIDGSVESGEMQSQMEFSATGPIKGGDGKDYQLSISTKGSSKEVRRPAEKK